MMYKDMTKEQLVAEKEAVKAKYEEYKAMGLNLAAPLSAKTALTAATTACLTVYMRQKGCLCQCSG